MSSRYIHQKLKNCKRRQRTLRAIKRQLRIAKLLGIEKPTPHRYHKLRAQSCGNSKCFMCGNPRKFFNEKTIQELSFDQTRNWNI